MGTDLDAVKAIDLLARRAPRCLLTRLVRFVPEADMSRFHSIALSTVFEIGDRLVAFSKPSRGPSTLSSKPLDPG
jgi:hypothetical protein